MLNVILWSDWKLLSYSFSPNPCLPSFAIYTEAAAATEPELCIPIQLGPKRALFVGDPLQLPATVMSRRAVKLGLARSLHERLMYECGFAFEMLNVQYRMNPAISAFPSSRFYKSKIANGENVSSPQYGNGTGLLEGRPYTFLQVDGVEEQGAGGSYKNESEAKTVVDMVARLQTIARSSPGDRSSWHSTDRIRIITFYQAQVGLIKRLLRDRGFGDKIVCATVDSSQGTEADVVIVSFVRSQVNGSSGPGGKVDARFAAGFLTDDRRMNVAMTRAKYQLVCIGNVRGLNRLVGANAETLRLLAADAQERNVVQPYPSMRNNNGDDNDTNARLDLFYNVGQNAKRPRLG
jgi:senataxin